MQRTKLELMNAEHRTRDLISANNEQNDESNYGVHYMDWENTLYSE